MTTVDVSQFPDVVQALANHYMPPNDPYFRHTNLQAGQCACADLRPLPRQLPTMGLPDGGICYACGGLTVRTGSCTTCTECGTSSGCG